MADKIVTVQDLVPPEVGLNIPPFLRSQGHMSGRRCCQTQSTASPRVHVERVINAIKKFSYLGRSCSTERIRCYKPNVDCVCCTL